MKKLFAVLLLLSGCTGIPDGLAPVSSFELDRHLGTWHEVARLDHSFERGLERVTANYSVREDGGVKVLNRGYSQDKGDWNEAEGKAYFVGETTTGHLKVSFFGPFYGSYIIIELDPDYQYSLVAGPDFDYLWILSRQPVLDPKTLQRLIARADSLGFDTGQLIFPAPAT
jgi:apolipoprotein D and lipocalin family protein